MTRITNDMLTDWYSCDVKPVHVGVYIVETINGTDNTYYCTWTGVRWGACGRDPQEAEQRSTWSGSGLDRKWRGLRAPYKD